MWGSEKDLTSSFFKKQKSLLIVKWGNRKKERKKLRRIVFFQGFMLKVVFVCGLYFVGVFGIFGCRNG